MMRFTIDRFEGQIAIVELEDRSMVDIPIILLPEESKEGDILKIIIDDDEISMRKKRIEEKFRNLFED